MPVQRLWRRILSLLEGGPRPKAVVRRRTCRLQVEALEDRLVPTTWFVATRSTADNFHPQNSGNNANDGLSPATPFGDIQQAVNVAQNGDRIFVAKGAYGYNAALNQLSAPLGINPAVVMLMDKSVEIYGGFNNDFSVCDPVLYHTVIDGGLAARGVYVLSNQHDINFLMSGFTIEQGLGQAETHLNPATAGLDAIDGIGGGMWINDAARHGAGSFILQDMVFYKNTARGTSLATVMASSGGGHGGGLAVRSVGNLALHRVTFSDNTAQSGSGGAKFIGIAGGGAFEVDNSSLQGGGQVTGDTLIFVNNTATGPTPPPPQGAVAEGGAMSIYSANVTLQQVTAFNNQALDVGDGGAFFVQSSNFSLTDASLRSNSAGSNFLGAGGALSAMNTNVTFNRVQILGNSAPDGGGISLKNNTGTTTVTPFAANITNSVFADNVSSAPATTATGGAFVQGVNANFTFTTFAQNTSSGTAVPAIRLPNFGIGPPATVTLTDSVIANQANTSGVAAVVVEAGNTVTYNHVLSANNTLLDNSGSPSGGTFNGENTVTTAANAQFVAPGAPNYDYSILSSSPAVGQGVAVPGVTIDIDQQPRKSTPDLGAYESPPTPVARQTVATYDPGSGLWQIRNSNTTGFANLGMFTFGLGGNNSFPVVGDWNATGKVGIGVVEVIRTSDPAIPPDPATHLEPYVLTWKLRNSQTSGAPDIAQFEYGRGIDIPVVGDWDGNGSTTVGIYEPDTGTWKLRNSNTKGTPDFNTPGQSGFAYGGLPGDLPVVGDWNGDGKTTVGVVERVGTGGVLAWKLRDSNSAGFPDAGNFAFGGAAFGSFPVAGVGTVFGAADVQPITGDWNGDRRTTVGVLEPNGQWLLKDSNAAGAPDAGNFFFGEGQSRPLAADFAGLL